MGLIKLPTFLAGNKRHEGVQVLKADVADAHEHYDSPLGNYESRFSKKDEEKDSGHPEATEVAPGCPLTPEDLPKGIPYFIIESEDSPKKLGEKVPYRAIFVDENGERRAFESTMEILVK